MALFSRLHTWVSNEVLTASDLNGEFNNIITNMVATSIVGASANLAAMQTIADPGGIGTESLAGSQADEIQRLRFMLKYIVGRPQWYDHTGRNLGAGQLALAAADFTDGSIAGSRLIDNTIPEPKYGAGTVSRRALAPVGQVVSTSSGSFTSGNTSDAAVTNLSVSITTTGRPVKIEFIHDGSGVGYMGPSGSGGPQCIFSIYRDGVVILASNSQGSGNGALYIPPSAHNTTDYGATAATHTYALYVRVIGTTTASVNNVKMVVYEA